MFDKKRILITGGTGSFGQKFVEFLIKNTAVHEVVILSRDEFKQDAMSKRFPPDQYPIRYFLGDIRDKDRLMQAFVGVNYVVHAAALKQVPALEANPTEAINTNVIGAKNIIEAALERSVEKVIGISTDKAVAPINLYGATKLVMEKLLVAANTYTRYRDITFCAVRYGNVAGSRGSVLPFFIELIKKGVKELPVTDKCMTRFWITLDQGVALVYNAICNAGPGEIYVPKSPSVKVTELVKALTGNYSYKIIGIRPGEKIHETLIGEDEGRNTVDMGDSYIILPQDGIRLKRSGHEELKPNLPSQFCYRSDTNDKWLSQSDLKTYLNETLKPYLETTNV